MPTDDDVINYALRNYIQVLTRKLEQMITGPSTVEDRMQSQDLIHRARRILMERTKK